MIKETGRNLEEELVREAVGQMRKNGVDGFSARAVAEACGVSCAAPFKYFNGRQGLFLAISEYLDRELLQMMEEIERRFGTDYKKAHLEMNTVYIRYLCENPFLISEYFWRTINEGQAGIRKWRSFQKMAAQFRSYCRERGIPQEVYKSYYFNFQTLAYGAAFVTVNSLLLEGSDVWTGIGDLQERIYRNLEETMGLA